MQTDYKLLLVLALVILAHGLASRVPFTRESGIVASVINIIAICVVLYLLATGWRR